MKDPYSLNGYPCFGSYSVTDSDCYDCDMKEGCKANKLAEQRAAVNPGRGMTLPKGYASRSSPINAVMPRPPQGAMQAIGHTDFTPFPGESTATRFFKNAALNSGATFFQTCMNFCIDFQWKPSRPVLQVVEAPEPQEEPDKKAS